MKTCITYKRTTAILVGSRRVFNAILMSAVAALIATASPVAAGNTEKSSQAGPTTGKPPKIVPHKGKIKELYGILIAEWWRMVFATPIVNDDHVFFSGGVMESSDFKDLVFVANPPGVGSLHITVPTGTMLFLPVTGAECSVIEEDPFHGDDEASLLACANGHMDTFTEVFATIDGVPVDLDGFRLESPIFEFGPLPEDNVLGAPAGATSLAVDVGISLLIGPLRKGSHVIQSGGIYNVDEGFPFDGTIYVTVEDHRKGDEKDKSKKAQR